MAASSMEDALNKAHEHGALLLSNDEKRELYHVEIKIRCECCAGMGRVLKPRCKTKTVQCVTCNGYGYRTIAEYVQRRS